MVYYRTQADQPLLYWKAITIEMSAKSLAITANRALRSQAPRARRQLATAAQAEVQQQQPTPIASTSKPVTPLSPPVEPSRAPHIVIPAPGLTPTRGTNRLRIDVAGGVPSSAHSLAIIQALEERVGRIVHIQQTKVSIALTDYRQSC